MPRLKEVAVDASSKTVLVDDEVTSKVLGIIRGAKTSLVVVTPFVELWGHAEDALKLAVKKGVQVKALVRDEEKVTSGEGVARLVAYGVHVLTVERLHAKIYLNDDTVLVSSMNLTKYSTENSKEIAVVIRDPQEAQQVRAYVTETLIPLARPLGAPPAQPVGQRVPGGKVGIGLCIRCGTHFGFDPNRPLCPACYAAWSQWGNPDYPEHVCHSCGVPSPVSYAKPLCGRCFQAIAGGRW